MVLRELEQERKYGRLKLYSEWLCDTVFDDPGKRQQIFTSLVDEYQNLMMPWSDTKPDYIELYRSTMEARARRKKEKEKKDG